MKIDINADVLEIFLKSILKIIPGNETGAKFNITSDGCVVRILNDSKTIRAHFTTNSMTSEEEVEFCFLDLTKLLRSINLIKSYYKKDNLKTKLDFNNTFISYSNAVKFKLKVVRDEEMIQKYISKEFAKKLESSFEFETSEDLIKAILQYSNVVNLFDSKIYFAEQNGIIIGEIDDKKNTLADSVGAPIGKLTSGKIDKLVAVSLDNFRTFNTLPTDIIKIMYTTCGRIEVNSEYKKDDDFIKMHMICTTLKG